MAVFRHGSPMPFWIEIATQGPFQTASQADGAESMGGDMKTPSPPIGGGKKP